MKEEKNNAELIREIVDRINSSDEQDKDPVTGLALARPGRQNGMIFETASSVSAEQEENAEEPKSSAPAPVTDVQPSETAKEEFLIPDTFEVSEKYNAPLREEQPTRIYTTYMPNFSGASDNYRMKNDPRPRINTVDNQPKATKSDSDPAISEKDESDSFLSPSDTVEVITNGIPEKEQPALNVFKFSEEFEKARAAEADINDEERVLNEIHSLLKNDQKPEPVSAPEPEPEIAASSEPVSAKRTPPPAPSPSEPVYDYTPGSMSAVDEIIPPEGANETSLDGKRALKHEFTSSYSRDAFKDRFLDRLLSQKVRLTVAAVLAFFTLLFENLWIFGTDPSSLFGLSDRGGIDLFMDLQFAFCMTFLALPEIIDAIRHAFRKKLTPELMLPIEIILLTAYSLLGFASSAKGYPMFASLYAVAVVAAIAGALLRTRADFLAFRIVATGAEKHVVDKKMTRTLEKENIALDGAVDESKSRIARVFRTPFVSHFMKRSSKCTEDSRLVLHTFMLSFGIALVAGAVVFFVADPIRGLAVFSMTFLLSVPSLSYLLHKLPFCHAETFCASKMSAAIGESSLLDYAGVDVMTYEDTEIFGKTDVNFKRIMLYGERDNLPKAMKQMASLYLVAGGPLRSLFAFALDRKPSPATGVRVEEDGVYGQADGHRIDSGTLSYMIRKGYRIPEEDENEKLSFADSTRVLYAAEDGRIYAKFLIRYSFSENFTSLLPILKENGITILIYTSDPCIQKDLISALTGGQSAIRFMKRTSSVPDSERVYRRISAGLVTLGDKTDALTLVLLSKEYQAFQRKFAKISFILTVIGAVAAIPLAILGIPSVYPAVLQFAGCAALWLASKNRFLPQNSVASAPKADDVKEQHVVLR